MYRCACVTCLSKSVTSKCLKNRRQNLMLHIFKKEEKKRTFSLKSKHIGRFHAHFTPESAGQQGWFEAAVMWFLGKGKMAFSYRDAREGHILCEGLTLVLLYNYGPWLCRCWVWYSQTPTFLSLQKLILLARLLSWAQLSVQSSSWHYLGCSSDRLKLQLKREQAGEWGRVFRAILLISLQWNHKSSMTYDA